jgi:hypothetical protein
MSNIKKFPGMKETDDTDKYKAFIGVLIQHDNSIEVTLPSGFSKAEIAGMLEMGKLMVVDTFGEED